MAGKKKLWLVGNHSQASQEVLSGLSLRLRAEGFEFDEKNPELVITVGGDGTLLRALHLYEDQLDTVQFTGVHTGHLGFYTDFLTPDLPKLITALKDEAITTATRYPLLKVTVTCSDGQHMEHHALNESTFRRVSRTLVSDILISDNFFEKFRGDGLSISTPSGSTAYNKSVGGAVMHPRVEAMQLAEIASLNNSVFRTLGSSMVVAKTDRITLYPEEADDYYLTIDQLDFQYKNIVRIDYEMDGATVAFADYAHTPFWERVRNSFIGSRHKPFDERGGTLD